MYIKFMYILSGLQCLNGFFLGYTDRTLNAITYKFICLIQHCGILGSKSRVMK